MVPMTEGDQLAYRIAVPILSGLVTWLFIAWRTERKERDSARAQRDDMTAAATGFIKERDRLAAELAAAKANPSVKTLSLPAGMALARSSDGSFAGFLSHGTVVPMPPTCPNGHSLPANARHCPRCGARAA